MSSNNVRYDWYQTDSTIVITIAQKGMSVENCQILYDDKTRELKILWNNKVIFLNVLYHPASFDKKSLKCTPFKLEVTLQKLIDERWPSLTTSHSVKPIVSNDCKWDNLAKQVEKEEENESEGVDKLFQQLYRDANDDVKKAMLKSYSESCGTVLSTNWAEVKNKKTEVKPPDCMEFKKY